MSDKLVREEINKTSQIKSKSIDSKTIQEIKANRNTNYQVCNFIVRK